jgi:hypothetical protein
VTHVSSFWKAEETAEKEISAEDLAARKTAGKGPLIAPPLPNILLLGLTPSKYLLKVLKQIRSSDLEETLMVVPFGNVKTLLRFIQGWLKEVSSKNICLTFAEPQRGIVYQMPFFPAQSAQQPNLHRHSTLGFIGFFEEIREAKASRNQGMLVIGVCYQRFLGYVWL